MEVDRQSFCGRLFELLEAVTSSPFVAIDLELSGVPSRPNFTRSRGKQTLQERYAEAREAADRYTILQVGLTCVTEEKNEQEDTVYTLRPYNLNLNPLIDERLGLERIFAFQSGALEFLMTYGFNLDDPIKRGVPYLSQEEVKMARKLAETHFDQSSFEELQLGPEDVESLAFVQKSREEIEIWLKADCDQSSELRVISRNRPSTTGTSSSCTDEAELSRFEKRLVHQLVRSEYPSLVSIGRASSVVIKFLNKANEEKHKKQKLARVEDSIRRQKGFLWVVEAMTRGTLEGLNPSILAVSPITGASLFYDRNEYETRMQTVRERAQTHQPVLVGHNIFLDLIYFYRTFFGPLPETVEGFSEAIRELFPKIVDTKYMATYNCGDINPASSLEEIEGFLCQQEKPIIRLHPNHLKYREESLHEAGYDSFLTAKILIQLSSKLWSSEEFKSQVMASAPEDDNMLDPRSASFVPGSIYHTNGFSALESIKEPLIDSDATMIDLLNIQAAAGDDTIRQKKRKKDSASSQDHFTRFSYVNPFESLASPCPSDSDLPSGSDGGGGVFPGLNGSITSPSPLNDHRLIASESLQKPHSLTTLTNNPAQSSLSPVSYSTLAADAAPFELTLSAVAARLNNRRRHATGHRLLPIDDPGGVATLDAIPERSSPFWDIYGNKLRLFGTIEGVMKL